MDTKIDRIIAYARQHPDEWKRNYGDENLPTIEDEVRAYFNHYSSEEGLAERVCVDLGITT